MTEHVDEQGRIHALRDQKTPPVELLGRSSTSSDTSIVEESKDSSTAVDPELQPVTPEVDVYPGDHGDWRAILSSVGVFFAIFVGFGILNIPGTFVTYWQENQLSEYSESQVGWIAAMQFFFTLFGSVFTGRWFDLHGGRVSHQLFSSYRSCPTDFWGSYYC